MDRLWPLERGEKYSVKAWGTDSKCEVLEVLEDLRRSSPDSHLKMGAILRRVGEHGPAVLSPNTCRVLGPQLFELKETGGNLRLFCFFDPYRCEVIIVESAWSKNRGGKTQQNKRIRRLQERLKIYLERGSFVEDI